MRELLLLRHGESEGNIAAARAAEADAHVIDVPARDADVELTELGLEQAAALGSAMAGWPAEALPEVVVSSSYRRARATAVEACRAAGLDLDVTVDERLRDRELGVLDRLTSAGVAARHPEEAERRAWHGKYYHRPAGGESWVDVALRLRAWLREATDAWAGRRVLVVSHDVTVTLIRAICEGLDEEQTMDLARGTPVRNASLSRLVRDEAGQWHVEEYDVVDHLVAAGLTPTQHGGERHGRG